MGGWKNCIGLLLIVTSCVLGEHKGRLTIEDILPEDPSDYDKMGPPKIDGKPTVVNFRVTVIGLDSIDDDTMTYDADIFLSQSWKDYRIRVPQNMTAESKLLEVDWLNSLWRPDSYFKNAKSVTFQTMTVPNHYMSLYKDQTLMYMTKLTLKLSCDMYFVIFPHDTQFCSLQIESFSHTNDDVLFEWDPIDPLIVYPNIALPQLALENSKMGDCTTNYKSGKFTCLEVTFELRRRIGYYLLRTYIPTVLIVIMSWVSFWINPEASPARVSLGVTSSLTLFTQHAKSQATLPPVSYLKAIDVFMSLSTILTLKLSCDMNFAIFPHDTQFCFLQIESFSHTVNDVIFQWDSEDPLIVYPNIELPQLALQSSYMSTCTTTYTNGNFTCLEVVFELQRRLGYYLLRTYIPTLLIVIMSWVSFWINPEASPARVTLGVTSSLTLFTQHAKSQSALPPVSYLKAIDVFMSISTIFVFLALMEYCLVNIILSQANSPKYFFQIGRDKSVDEPTAPVTRSRIEIARYRALHVDRVSRVLFPVLFAFSNVLYWVILWFML